MSSEVKAVNRKTKSLSFYDFTYLGRFLLKFIFVRSNKSDLRPHWMFNIAIAILLLAIITEFAQDLSNLINDIHYLSSIIGLWDCLLKSLAIVKACEIVMRKREFKELMDEMDGLFPKILNMKGEFNLRKNLKEFTNFMALCALTCMMLTLMFTVMNLMRVESKDVNGIHWQIDFIYPILLPFDPYQHGIFELVHIFQQLAAYFAFFSITGSDALLYCLINYFCIYYDFLAQQISQIDTQNTKTEQQIIVHIVEEHEKCIM